MPTKKSTGQTKEKHEIGAKCIRLLLSRHGVPLNQHAYVIAEFFKLSYQQGRRRVTGFAPTTLEELKRIGTHYGETLEQVLAPALDECWERSQLIVGTWRAHCKVQLGPQVEPPFKCELVAIGSRDAWIVVPASDIKMPAHEVYRLLLCEPESSPPALGSSSK